MWLLLNLHCIYCTPTRSLPVQAVRRLQLARVG